MPQAQVTVGAYPHVLNAILIELQAIRRALVEGNEDG